MTVKQRKGVPKRVWLYKLIKNEQKIKKEYIC